MSDGWFLLLDCPPRTALSVDGVRIRVKAGFRGFHSVPPGRHVAELEYYSGEKAVAETEVAAGGGSVFEFFHQPPRFDPSPRAAALLEEVRAGHGQGGLWRFPPPGTQGDWEAPESQAGPASELVRPIPLILRESPAEKRRYYLYMVGLYAVALIAGWLCARVLGGAFGASAGVAWIVGYGVPLAVVTTFVVRARGFRLMR